jgi:hypothetical protein
MFRLQYKFWLKRKYCASFLNDILLVKWLIKFIILTSYKFQHFSGTIQAMPKAPINHLKHENHLNDIQGVWAEHQRYRSVAPCFIFVIKAEVQNPGRLIFLSLQYRIFFMSPFWHLEFWGSSYLFGNFCASLDERNTSIQFLHTLKLSYIITSKIHVVVMSNII